MQQKRQKKVVYSIRIRRCGNAYATGVGAAAAGVGSTLGSSVLTGSSTLGSSVLTGSSTLAGSSTLGTSAGAAGVSTGAAKSVSLIHGMLRLRRLCNPEEAQYRGRLLTSHLWLRRLCSRNWGIDRRGFSCRTHRLARIP
jgi:hypothetical protein